MLLRKRKKTPLREAGERKNLITFWRTVYTTILLKLFFPETVEVAVFVNRYGLLAAESNCRLGLALVIEINELTAVLILNVDPSDVVGLCHRMENRSYCYVEKISVDLNLGNMLFAAGINSTCFKELHRAAAADCGNALVLNDLDHLSACFANIEFNVFHNLYHLSSCFFVLVLLLYHQSMNNSVTWLHFFKKT